MAAIYFFVILLAYILGLMVGSKTIEKKLIKIVIDAIEGSELSNEDKIYLLKEIEKRLSV